MGRDVPASGRKLEHYEVTFAQGRAEYRVRQRGIESFLQLAVSPEHDIDLRRLELTNRSGRRRRIEVTTYAEVVLLEQRAELTHPAFQALFLQTEILSSQSAILCARRPRDVQENWPWLLHMMVPRSPGVAGEASYETDRARFLGRNRTAGNPRAMEQRGALSNTAGAVLDPVIAMRREVELPPGQSVVLDVITGVAPTREQACTLLDHYRDTHMADRAFELAWTHSQVLLHQLRANEADVELFATLAGSLLYANPLYRANPSILAPTRRVSPRCGATAFRATGPSCSCASATTMRWIWCARRCRRTPTGATRGCAPT